MDVSSTNLEVILSAHRVSGPGSFLEVRKILPLLTTPPEGSQAFHVVAFSLPGYGFSDAPRKKGFGIMQMAEVCASLMPSPAL